MSNKCAVGPQGVSAPLLFASHLLEVILFSLEKKAPTRQEKSLVRFTFKINKRYYRNKNIINKNMKIKYFQSGWVFLSSTEVGWGRCGSSQGNKHQQGAGSQRGN
jgi:hypothetical protein